MESPTIANAIAALLLHIRDTNGKLPHIYFNWTEGNPVVYLLRYVFFGEGEIAPVTREVLRKPSGTRYAARWCTSPDPVPVPTPQALAPM